MSETNTRIVDIRAEDIIKSLYLTYAEEVILSRALTKVQDGLKPSQRYTLYAMHEMGLKNSAVPKKCARVVGDVIGKYNPHGDQSAYDALVGLSEAWTKRYPLITFQGNNGSVDGDPPAAMRYTECKLSKIGESMLEGLDKNAVDMIPNFDDSEKEPKYLPGIFPAGLCNGTTGIATAMASSMAPHYAGDIFKAIKYVLNCVVNKEQPKLDNVINIVKAPDFPTGAVIVNPEEARKAYRTGKGTVKIRGKYELKEAGGRTTIVFTEIPYGINKKSLVEDLGAKVYNEDADKVFKDNVADVVDRSEKGRIAICVELKKNGNPDIVLNNIFKQTKMESSFSINNVMLVDGRPVENMNLLQIIELYIKSQLQSKARVVRYDMEQYAKRLELVQGYINANSQIEEVIKTIRASKDRETTIANLVSVFGFSEAQAKGLYARQLGSLNSFDVNALIEEAEVLKNKILTCKELLCNRVALVNAFIFSINNVMLVDGRPVENMNLLQLIELYIKSQLQSKARVVRYDMEQYAKRLELVQGYINANSQIEEVIKTIRASKDRETTIANLVSVFGFSEAQAKGLYARQLGSLNSFDVNALIEEAEVLKNKILTCKELLCNRVALVNAFIQDIDDYIARGYFKGDHRRTEIAEKCNEVEDRDLIEDENLVVFYTHNGMVKAIRSRDYGQQGRGGKGNGVKLREDDFVEEVLYMSNKDDIIVITDKGKAYAIPAFHIPIVSKAAMGKYLNNYVTFEDEEKVVKVFSLEHNDTTHQLLMVTKKGLAKRISLENMNIRKNGLKVINFAEGDGLASVILTTGEGNVVTVTRNGFAMRTAMENISVCSRTARGNIAMRFKSDDDYIISAVSVADEDILLVISDKGLCKRCNVSDIPARENRGGKGVMLYKPTDKSGHALSVVKVEENETLFVVTTNDMIIRMPVKDFSIQSRNGHGTKAINLADGAEIASITLAPSEEPDSSEEEGAAA